ncbi:hypothetical protein REPUB_Repub18cG0152300 [Reevesia pubescens]
MRRSAPYGSQLSLIWAEKSTFMEFKVHERPNKVNPKILVAAQIYYVKRFLSSWKLGTRQLQDPSAASSPNRQTCLHTRPSGSRRSWPRR